MTHAADERAVAAAWVRLGALFNVAPAQRTPDIERLLLDTVRLAGGNSRLLTMAATWLNAYGEYVAKRRLAMLIRQELGLACQPIMGLLLEWAQTHNRRHRHRFREALAECRPASEPGPLLEVSRRSGVLRALARRQASALSRRWGCWVEDFAVKDQALRPAEWVARTNPSLRLRALCGGDLAATIAVDAAAGGRTFGSESELARRYGASRAAIRDAILRLKMAGYASQSRAGNACPVAVAASAKTC